MITENSSSKAKSQWDREGKEAKTGFLLSNALAQLV